MFAAALAAELVKLRTQPATWIAFAAALLANTALGALAATDVVRIAGGTGGPVAAGQLGTLMLAPVYAFAGIAAAAGGGEHRAGQLRVSLAAVPRRGRFAAAQGTAVAAAGLLAAVPAVLPGYLVQPDPGVAGLAARVAAYVLLSLTGYGAAVVARGVAVPLAVLFALPVLGSPVLRQFAPALPRFLPHEAALSLVGLPGADLGPGRGLLVLGGWAVLAGAAARVSIAARDA